MNVWVKTTAILILTLTIGFALGWYGSGVYHRYKRSKMFAEMRAKRGSGGRFSMPKKVAELIQPTDAQQDTVHAIVSKYHEKFIAKSVGDFEFVRTTIDSMILELQPVLTEEQFEQLEDRRHFFRRGSESGPPLDGEFMKGPPGRRGRKGRLQEINKKRQKEPETQYN